MWNPRLMALALLCSVVVFSSRAELLPGTYIGLVKERPNGEPLYQVTCRVFDDGFSFVAVEPAVVAQEGSATLVGYEGELRNAKTLLARSPRQWQVRVVARGTNITGRLVLYPGFESRTTKVRPFELSPVQLTATAVRPYSVITRTGTVLEFVSVFIPTRPPGGTETLYPTPRPPTVPVPGSYSGSGSVIVTGNPIVSREDAEARIEAMRRILAGADMAVILSPIRVKPVAPSVTNVMERPPVISVPEPILVTPPGSSAGAVISHPQSSSQGDNGMEEILLRRVVLTREIFSGPQRELAPVAE